MYVQLSRLYVGLAILIATSLGEARGEAPLRDVLNDLDDPKLQPTQRALHEMALSSVENGLSWANTYIRQSLKQPRMYCKPEKLALGSPQIVAIVRRAVKENPKIAEYPYGYAVLLSMQHAFPCTAKPQ